VLAPNALQTNHLHEADLTLTGKSTRFDPYYTSIPFFYHCRADADGAKLAGFFIDNGYKASVDFEKRHAYSFTCSGGQYTEYVFAGPSMSDILAAYTLVTGRMGAPPIWALGHHQCRFHDYTDKGILDIGRAYRERKIPCDVLWLDIGYMNGFRVFTWDSDKFPNVADMIAKMRADKLRLVTIIDPGVKAEPGYPVFDEGRTKNLFCKTEAGQLYIGQVWPGRTVFPDFVRPEVRAWWAELNARHVGSGIAGLWIDMNEPATGDIEPFAMRFDRDASNAHGATTTNMRFSWPWHAPGPLHGESNLRSFIPSQAGFAGIQRHAARWLGVTFPVGPPSDEHPHGDGHGHFGTALHRRRHPGFSANPTPELAARWMQYGAMTILPVSQRSGRTRPVPLVVWSGVEKRAAPPSGFATACFRTSQRFHALERNRRSDPTPADLRLSTRPPRARTDDAHVRGRALVAPVLAPGQTARHVYLPQGTWVDWYGERHAGGRSSRPPRRSTESLFSLAAVGSFPRMKRLHPRPWITIPSCSSFISSFPMRMESSSRSFTRTTGSPTRFNQGLFFGPFSASRGSEIGSECRLESRGTASRNFDGALCGSSFTGARWTDSSSRRVRFA
jgi:alpha-glucosidase